MKKLSLVTTNQFEKDILLMQKRGKNISKFKLLLEWLVNQHPLPIKYHNHKLKDNFKDRWECHIETDWLLIYYLNNEVLRLELTGTHGDLLK